MRNGDRLRGLAPNKLRPEFFRIVAAALVTSTSQLSFARAEDQDGPAEEGLFLSYLWRTYDPISGECEVSKRGKSGGGMIIRFPRRRESDSVGECRRRTILTACRLPS